MKNSQLNFFLLLLALSQQSNIEEYSVKEGEPKGTLVKQLDAGIEYTIRSEELYLGDEEANSHDSPVSPVFDIVSGNELRTLVIFDRDTLPGDSYQLILANKNVANELYNCRILIDDINDNPPTFDQDNVQVQISEGEEIGFEEHLPGVTDIDEKHGLSKGSVALIG